MTEGLEMDADLELSGWAQWSHSVLPEGRQEGQSGRRSYSQTDMIHGLEARGGPGATVPLDAADGFSPRASGRNAACQCLDFSS